MISVGLMTVYSEGNLDLRVNRKVDVLVYYRSVLSLSSDYVNIFSQF